MPDRHGARAASRGWPRAEVADTFYTALLMHVGCSALSHETAAAWGDERGVLSAVAQTNVADPADVAATLHARDPARESRRRSAPASSATRRPRDSEFGRDFDTGSCEVASATARRVGLGAGRRARPEGGRRVVERRGPAGGLEGRGDRAPRAHRAGRRRRRPLRRPRRRRGGGRGPAAPGRRDPRSRDRRGSSSRTPTSCSPSRARATRASACSRPSPSPSSRSSDLTAVAAAFGDLADLKTPWTHGHSSGVARLACGRGAGALRLDAQDRRGPRGGRSARGPRPGGGPNAIWEKPGPLTAAEWEQVRMHPYHSERILATSSALEPMARAAGMHHERLDGSGYHRGCRAASSRRRPGSSPPRTPSTR